MERRSFITAASLYALFGVYWSYVPIARMRSKVGSWANAWSELRHDPWHWALEVVVRLLFALALTILAVRLHRHRPWAGYVMLMVGVPLTVAFDIALLTVGQAP
jgi:hypothetical protein